MKKRPALLSYRMRISLAMALFALIPLILLIVGYIVVGEEQLVQSVLSQHLQALELYDQQLSRGLQEMQARALYVKNDTTIRTYLNRMQTLDMSEKLQFITELQEIESAISVDNDGLALRWYSDYTDHSYGGFCYTKEDLAARYAGKTEDLDQILNMEINETLTLIREPENGTKKHTVSVYTKINNVNGTDHILEISMPIAAMLYSAQSDLPGNPCIGISFAQNSQSQTIILLDNRAEARKCLEEYFQTGDCGEYYPVEITATTQPEGKLVCLLESDYVWGLFWKARLPFVGMIIFMIVTVLVCSYVTSRLLTRKVIQIISHIDHQLGRENSEQDAVDGEDKELSDIAQRVRELTERSREQGQQLEMHKLEKKQLELELLQMRFNPHFLYNTLGSIRYQVKDPRIRKSIDSLIAYYRIVLSKGSRFISIASEIQMVLEYLNLEIFAFDLKNVQCVYEIDEEAEKLQIVKHLLQPIVENALEHGVRSSENVATITIRARLQGENVVIDVEDTGIGMTPEQIETITTKPCSSPVGGGYGVYNVIQRIKTYYGSDYGVEFTSELGKGTVVTITIPQERMADEVDPQKSKK
jgi:signal transduction histidine kinase